VPLPESAARLAEELGAQDVFGQGSLIDALLERVRRDSGLDVKRSDFKLDMLSAHLFMNLRVVDEHGRQLGEGRSLGALKAELGGKARGAFQALAALQRTGAATLEPAKTPQITKSEEKPRSPSANRSGAATKNEPSNAPSADARYTGWAFGELPELMEIRRGAQTLVGFPALIDHGDAVTLEVFDEPEVAAARHRAGLRRLFALQIRDALKYLEKNIPDLQKMAVAFMPLGTLEELRTQIIDLALDRAFLVEPLPADEAAFTQRLAEGRSRLTLIANEVARLAGLILTEYAAAARKLKDSRPGPEVAADVTQQLQRLVGKTFLLATPWAALQHLPRYLKAIVLRLDKLRADPGRDTSRAAEVRAMESRYWRLVAERKGQVDARMTEYRWLLEELRVSLFAQELRTPQPVSVKRLDKLWAQLVH